MPREEGCDAGGGVSKASWEALNLSLLPRFQVKRGLAIRVNILTLCFSSLGRRWGREMRRNFDGLWGSRLRAIFGAIMRGFQESRGKTTTAKKYKKQDVLF